MCLIEHNTSAHIEHALLHSPFEKAAQLYAKKMKVKTLGEGDHVFNWFRASVIDREPARFTTTRQIKEACIYSP